MVEWHHRICIISKDFSIVSWLLCVRIWAQFISFAISCRVIYQKCFSTWFAFQLWMWFIRCHLLYYFRLPWDWRNPLGYLKAACLQFFWVYSGIFIIISILSTFVGICTLSQGFALDIQQNFTNLTEWNSKSMPLSNRDSIKCNRKLCDIMEFHSNVKAYVKFYKNWYWFDRIFYLQLLLKFV